MTDRELQLTQRVSKLQCDLSDAHDMLAKSIYKLGVVAAVIGFAPEATHLEIQRQLAAVAVLPKSELEDLRRRSKNPDPA